MERLPFVTTVVAVVDPMDQGPAAADPMVGVPAAAETTDRFQVAVGPREAVPVEENPRAEATVAVEDPTVEVPAEVDPRDGHRAPENPRAVGLAVGPMAGHPARAAAVETLVRERFRHHRQALSPLVRRRLSSRRRSE
jgi:hypothetical protein